MLKIIAFFFRKTGAVFNRTGNFFYYLGNKIYKPEISICEQNKIKWYSIDGDNTLRVEYPLNSNSIVFDVGGYKGDWSAEIYARYNCKVYILEPVKKFSTFIQKRFKNNPNVKVFPFGLSDENKEVYLSVMDESSSVYRSKTKYHSKNIEKELIQLKSFTDFIREHNITFIDLIKINIEGGEYELLEKIISSGFIKNIDNLQIQFHDFVENAEFRMKEIKKKLSKTHELTYEYIYVWENWKKK
jgi:FkbM family methyltransferase